MPLLLYAQSVDALNRQAQEYYDQKLFDKAITEWLRALELDPTNERIQQKIEMVYEEKHKKDLSFQKSKVYFRNAIDTLNQETFDEGEKNAVAALENFTIAYRIDPNDPELKALKERMDRLNSKLKNEREKNRLAIEKLEKYNALKLSAAGFLKNNDYENAISDLTEMLVLLPKDIFASEEKRKAELALENRLKWEKLKTYFLKGDELIAAKKYKEAITEFEQILVIDPENTDAKDKIAYVRDLLDSAENLERRRLQAEEYYISGINNLKNDNFNQAEDDLNNTLALMKNYKDAKARIAGIPALKKAYEERMVLRRQQELDKEFQNGLFYMSQGNYKAAVSSFEKMLILNPQSETAKKYIATAKEALQQQAEQEIDENSPYFGIINPLVVSGKSLYDKGDYAESLKRWEQIQSIFPKNKIAGQYLLLCQFKLNPETFSKFAEGKITEANELVKAKKYEDALYIFNLIKSIDKNYPKIDELIASTRKTEKIYVAPKLSPARINALYNEAISVYTAGGAANRAKAMANLKVILENDPNNSKAAIALNKMESESIIAVSSAQTTRLTPAQEAQVRTLYFNGIDLYAKGNFEGAISEWRKVLAIDPTHVKAKNNIKRTIDLLSR
ncbi:MAG: tetratricopeptide repeat protein [Spirochaetes bacterium]|nr:tetratricopeptide repeat protein [Spirochaetota bacterium]